MNKSNDRLRIALHQSKTRVGAIEDNTASILEAVELAEQQSLDLVVFPELFLCGYPPEDLLFRPEMPERIAAGCERIAEASRRIAIVLGAPVFEQGNIFNAALFFAGGSLLQIHKKQTLPNYAVFDERRYFSTGSDDTIVELSGFRLQISICEEIWTKDTARRIAAADVDMLISIHGSPFHVGKPDERLELVSRLSADAGVCACYLNLVGCQDELIFDGGSFVCDRKGSLIAGARQFAEDRVLCELHRDRAEAPTISAHRQVDRLDADEQLFRALVVCLRDYVLNNGFGGVVVGVSGGIDSAVVLALACAALGSDRVRAVMMPYSYTSSISIEDARQLTTNCGVDYSEISIDKAVDSYIEMLKPDRSRTSWQVTVQNIQARCRGLLLMAMSNYHGDLLLATGNKSEMAVGYATLYGDMCGGFAPLKDVDKTRVYRLARLCNRERELIPERIIKRPPSAELSPDQKDSDSLPEYDLLDQILAGYIEQGKSIEELGSIAGIDEAARVIAMVDRNEYKRQQAAVGARVTRLGFGKDRRMPITQSWKHR